MFNTELLKESITYKMPFGKYSSRMVADLPIHYLEWFLRKNNEFPPGKLGDMMSIIYQIKLNGLEEILTKMKHDMKK